MEGRRGFSKWRRGCNKWKVRPAQLVTRGRSQHSVATTQGAGNPVFLTCLPREHLEELCTKYEFEENSLRTQREELRDELRGLVKRYIQMKLPRMSLEVSAGAARETLGQLSDAQLRRICELQNERLALRLRVRSLRQQLCVQRRLADEIRAGITRVAQDSDEENESKFLANQLKNEVERLREKVEQKKQELAHLRQWLALSRREARSLRLAVRVAKRAIANDINAIRLRRQRMVRREEQVAIRQCPVHKAASFDLPAYKMSVLRKAYSYH